MEIVVLCTNLLKVIDTSGQLVWVDRRSIGLSNLAVRRFNLLIRLFNTIFDLLDQLKLLVCDLLLLYKTLEVLLENVLHDIMNIIDIELLVSRILYNRDLGDDDLDASLRC